MSHLHGVFIVAPPSDTSLKSGCCYGIASFGFGGEMDAVGERFHYVPILPSGDEGSRNEEERDLMGCLKSRLKLTQGVVTMASVAAK